MAKIVSRLDLLESENKRLREENGYLNQQVRTLLRENETMESQFTQGIQGTVESNVPVSNRYDVLAVNEEVMRFLPSGGAEESEMDDEFEEDEDITPAQRERHQSSQLGVGNSQRRQRQEEEFPSLRPPAKRKCQMVDAPIAMLGKSTTKKMSRKIIRFDEVDGKKLPIFEAENNQISQINPVSPLISSGSVADSGTPEKTEKRPPPITILKEEEYQNVKSTLEANQVIINRAIQTRGGIQIYVNTAADFRKAVQLIDDIEVPRYTYSLPQERPLKVVLRGIPPHFTEEEVKEDLQEQGMKIESVKRMRKNKDTPYSMMLVTTERSDEGKKIFQLRQVQGLAVKPEPKKKSTSMSQCYRCQKFGHVQRYCTAEYKCAFCANSHTSYNCPEPRGRGQPAKCINCGGAHPAFAFSCVHHPINVQQRTREAKEAQVRAATRVPGKTYAQSMGQVSYKNTSYNIDEDFELDKRIERILQKLLPKLLTSFHGK